MAGGGNWLCGLAARGGIAVALGIVRQTDGGALAVLMLMVFVAGLLAIAGAVRREHRGWLRTTLDQADVLQAFRRYEIGMNGVRVLGEIADAVWRWSVFSEVEQTGGLLFFWVQLHRGFYVPMRAFPSEEEGARALAYAAGCIEHARGKHDARR